MVVGALALGALFGSTAAANAALVVYDVAGTVGTDKLSGTVTLDTSLTPNGLQSVYPVIDLTLSGPQTSANGLIAATFTSNDYPPPAASPPPYGVFSDSVSGVLNGFDNGIGLYIPSDPATIGATSFEVISDQQPLVNGVPTGDNDIFGSATISAAPEPATWAMMLAGMFGIGGALRHARRREPVAA